MTENQELLSRLNDLDILANKRQIICYSDFLNMNEYSSYLMQKQSYSCDTVSFSEIADLERQMIAFIPDAFSLEEADFPIALLKIEPKHPKYAQEINHRDVLGAIMHLGIERKLVGDIFVQEKEALVLVNEKIVDFLCEQLNQIKRTDVVLKQIFEFPNTFEAKFEYSAATVSSLRLDCLVAEFANCSRTAAERYIKQGNTYVNSKQVEQCSYNCKVDDKISVRGVGKMVLYDVAGKSKKDKTIIRIKKYV